MNYDDYFQSFCKIFFKYQFLKNRTEITAAIAEKAKTENLDVAALDI